MVARGYALGDQKHLAAAEPVGDVAGVEGDERPGQVVEDQYQSKREVAFRDLQDEPTEGQEFETASELSQAPHVPDGAEVGVAQHRRGCCTEYGVGLDGASLRPLPSVRKG